MYQEASGGGTVLVNDRQADIGYLIAGRVRQDDQLHDGHYRHQRQDRLVAENLDEFFLYDVG